MIVYYNIRFIFLFNCYIIKWELRFLFIVCYVCDVCVVCVCSVWCAWRCVMCVVCVYSACVGGWVCVVGGCRGMYVGCKDVRM